MIKSVAHYLVTLIINVLTFMIENFEVDSDLLEEDFGLEVSVEDLIKDMSVAFHQAMEEAKETKPTEAQFLKLMEIHQTEAKNISQQEAMNFVAELHESLHQDAQEIWMSKLYEQRLDLMLLDREDFLEYYKEQFQLTTKWSDTIQAHLQSVNQEVKYAALVSNQEVN